MHRLGIAVTLGLLSMPALAQDGSMVTNLWGLSFTGDGNTVSGAQLFEASQRQVSQAQFASAASARGEATYRFPLDLPNALLAPSISLDYNSSQGDRSWVARGWSVGTGLPTVQRVIRKQLVGAYANVETPYTVIGGGFDGTLWMDQGVWRYSSSGSVEIEIEKLEGSTPGWRLSRGGVSTTLRARSDVDWGATGVEPVSFYPVHVVDLSGNAVVLEWEGNRLLTITYGGYCASVSPECAPTAELARVDFQYGPRDFTSTSYEEGVRDTRDLWLESIEVRGNTPISGDPEVEYRLIGSPEAINGATSFGEQGTGRLIEAIEGYGTNNGPDIRRVFAEFDYSRVDNFAPTPDPYEAAAPPFLDVNFTIPALVNSAEVAETVGSRPVVDYSGDGLPDYVFSYFQRGVPGYDENVVFRMHRTPDAGKNGESLFYQADPDLDAPFNHPGDTMGVPVNHRIFCSRFYAARYGIQINADLDGDGRIDRISSNATLESVDSIGTSRCGQNAFYGAAATWTIEYSVGSFENEIVQVPADFARVPSLGSLQWTLPPRIAGDEWDPLDIPVGQFVTGAKVELLDMNGDGWLDLVHVDDHLIEVSLKIPGRGMGWQHTKADPSFSWNRVGMPVRAHTTSVQVNDQIPEIEGGEEVYRGRALKTLTTTAFRDLNGDGLVDFVEACGEQESEDPRAYWWCGSYREAELDINDTTGGIDDPVSWRVWFNTGSGFDDPVDWTLPPDGGIAYITEVDEGANQLRQCSVTIAAGPMITYEYDPGNGVYDDDLVNGVDANGNGIADSNEGDGSFFLGEGVSILQEDIPWFDDVARDWFALFDGVVHTWVDASPTSWETPFNGNGPFEITYETFDSSANFAGSCSGPRGLQRGQRVMATLMDWDGDGRADYVDAERGLWFRNHGDGFGHSRDLPSWMPDGLQERWGRQNVMNVTNLDQVPDMDGLPPVFGSNAQSEEVYRVQDWNNDGIPDLVVPHPLTVPSEELLDEGVIYGAYPPPGLLTSVTIETGAETTLSYTPATAMDPAGLLLSDIGAIPNYQQMHLPRNLLTEIEVFDPITEEGASREIEYIDGVCDQGVCQGFRERVVSEYKRSPRFVAELGGEWVQQSRTSIEYLLSRDYAVPFRTAIRTDHNRAHLPGGPVNEALRRTWKTVDTFFQDPNDYTTDAVPNLWLRKRRVEDFAEDGPDTRKWELRLNRNAVGLTTKLRHVPTVPAAPEDEVTVRTDWLSNDVGSLYVPGKQWTSAWDAAAGGIVRVEQGEFGYDGGDLATGPVTRGLLTSQSACAGRPNDGFCSDTLDWDFERTSRGTVFHSTGREGAYVFEENTVLGFAWGETVAAYEINAMGHSTNRGVDHFGRLQSMTDANGVTVLTLHDAFGRETVGWTEGGGGPLRADFMRTYWAPSNPLPRFATETLYDYDPVTQQQRARQGINVVDGFGRAVQSWRRNHDESGFIVVDTIVDVQGNAVSTSIPRTEPQITPGTFQRSSDLMNESYFDAFGAAVWSRSDLAPVPAIVQNPAPGVHWTRDGENYRKEVVSDTHGRVVEVREGKGSTPLVTTGRYTYDGRARMTSFADANDNRHRYEWDGVGRLRDVYRDGGLGESPYYSYGYEGPYVVKAFEGDGTPAATWEYDALGRTTVKRVYEEYRAAFFDDPAAYATYSWTWDSIDDAQGVATWNGVRHATGDPAGQTRYFYDEYAPFGDRGRLTTVERQNLDFDPLVTHFEHNYAGAVTYMETPGGHFISTIYSNSQWKLEDVVGPVGGGGLEVVSYDYDSMGLLNGWAIDDAPTTSGFWRADFIRSTPNRLDAVEMGRTEQGSDRTSVDFSYLDNGWLNTKSIQPPFGTTEYLRYRYDKLGRAKSLAYVNAPDTHVFERYTFDDAGNLTHFKQGVGPDRKLWEYAAPVEFGEIPSRIDTRSGVKDTHMWDATTGRLTNWSTVDGLVTLRDRNFEYDGAGRLIYTEQDGEKTYLFYDVDNALVYEDRRGEIYERFSGYRSGPDETIDSVLPMLRVVSRKVGGVQVREPRVAMLDVDGHALFTWDLEGNELSREITGVYGLPLVGPNWDQGELWQIDGLHGSEADRSNEVVHFGARHTMFRDGMWMQPEPLLAMGVSPSMGPGATGGWYAAANPVSRADLDGYDPFTPSNAKQLPKTLEGTPELTADIHEMLQKSVAKDTPGADLEGRSILAAASETSPYRAFFGDAQLSGSEFINTAAGKAATAAARAFFGGSAVIGGVAHSHGTAMRQGLSFGDKGKTGAATVMAQQRMTTTGEAFAINVMVTEAWNGRTEMEVFSGLYTGIYRGTIPATGGTTWTLHHTYNSHLADAVGNQIASSVVGFDIKMRWKKKE